MATANVVKMESFLRLEREAVNIAPIHVLRDLRAQRSDDACIKCPSGWSSLRGLDTCEKWPSWKSTRIPGDYAGTVKQANSQI